MKLQMYEDVTTAAVQVRRLTEELETAKNELQPLQEPLGRNWTLGISWGRGSFFSGRGRADCCVECLRYYQQVKERCDKRTSREEIMRRRDQEIAGSG